MIAAALREPIAAARAPNIRERALGNTRMLAGSIVDQIASGLLKVGDQLPNERDLAARYQLPRHTVRKAMNLLERQGRVARFVGRGSFVVEPVLPAAAEGALTKRQWSLGELTEARLLFEPELARLIVERAGDDDLDVAARHLRDLAEATSWREFKEKKYAFHLALVNAAGNAFMTHIFELLIESRRASAWARGAHLADALDMAKPTTLREGEAIIYALRSRNASAASDAMRASLVRILVSLSAD